MSSPRSQLLRAAAFGFMVACGAGGLATAAVGAWHLVRPPSCEGLGRNECQLEQDTARELSHYQLFGGAGLLLLGAALLPGVRRAR